MKNILDIKHQKYILDNGLQVILYQDKSLPTVAVNIWYKVGSANERAGKTGFAHLFEHMMFQGSENVEKEMHFKYIQEAGGNLNGSTSIDRTNYFETVPSDHLEMALWLEADRMGFLLPSLTQEKLDNQKDVVMNERRQRYDNQPYGTAWETLFNTLYPKDHPYSWPTIGWMEDIEKFNLNDVSEFFKKYYAPNNASLVIGGNFETENAKNLVDKYFGSIPKGNGLDKIDVPEFLLPKTISNKVEDNVQLPRIYIGWHSAKFFHEDDAKLDILSDILSGSKNSRLYKKLVFDTQIAQDVSCFQYSGLIDGSFLLVATAKQENTVEEIKKIVFDEISNLITNGISTKELDRSKNSLKSSFIYSLQNLDSMVNQINNYNCYLDEPNSFLADINRYNTITEEDIVKTAKKYLEQNFVELQFVPKD
ncbi:MAG: insulinase family protein [Melioribacteraceae bacterium]|nr:insulinase family protein [Melioribacteraceae bacterium]